MTTTSSTRPLVLVAPRWEPRSYPGFSEPLAPFEGGAADFIGALVSAGAMPVAMPMSDDDELLADYLELCDGLAIPGGQDVSPALWGDDGPYDEGLLCPERDQMELRLIRAFLGAHKPIFATCRGAQILNVALGGTLCMDVPNLAPREGTVLWRHAGILTTPAHPVEVKAGSLLSRCVGGAPTLQVNSSHHCCVERLGEGLVLVAEATDGVPEAIELPSERFCLGVQWHPEVTWPTIATDALLWRAFVDACRG